MSVPVLLTVLDTNNAVAVDLLDDHTTSCSSYVDAASSLLTTAKFVAPTIVDDVKSTQTTTAAPSTCTPNLQNFTVQLPTKLAPHERVGLTGDSKSLGEWQLERSVPLKRLNDFDWTAQVMLLACRNINYRYFIYTEDKCGYKHIRRWETQLQPRTLKPGNSKCLIKDRFGEVVIDELRLNRGWLTNEQIVQLQFVREKMFQVHDIEKFDPENIYIEVLTSKNELKELTLSDTNETDVNVEIVKFEYGQSLLQPQNTFGINYKRGDTVIFHITIPYNTKTISTIMEVTTFTLVFYNQRKQPIGRTVINPTALTNSEGILELPIVEPHPAAQKTIAILTLPFLIVKPFTEAKLDFCTTYAYYWPKHWPSLDVGHRGNGKSFVKNPPEERENTIASFLRAYNSLADMIELDVHLTSDGVPIVYHDFGIRTAPQNKKITSAEQLEYVLIKDVSYAALKQLRVFAVINKEIVEYPSHNKETRFEYRIFPSLKDVLEQMPKTLGIDVEIKWPQLMASGGPESKQSIDKNFFVDTVLSVIISNGCGRPLIFSSFDADICTMLRFKQNFIPVMYLTIGETKKWAPYMDLRTRSVLQAINNAQAFELAGTAPHAEDFLIEDRGRELLQKARTLGQIAVIWGDDINSSERLKYFGDIGATAICYDRTDLYMSMDKQHAFFNSPDLMAEFDKQFKK